MIPSPEVRHRPGLVVIKFDGLCSTWLPPDAARRFAADLRDGAARAEGRRPAPRVRGRNAVASS